jgi:uncharacterized membrane protein YkoI
MSSLVQRVAIAILSAGVILSAAQAVADSRSKDHDAVRRAVERGELRPLADILASVRGKLPGQIAGVEIEHKDGRWVYEFRLVNDKGQLFKAYVDGRSGEIERIRQR